MHVTLLALITFLNVMTLSTSDKGHHYKVRSQVIFSSPFLRYLQHCYRANSIYVLPFEQETKFHI
jgi:hypothetical protein